MAALLVHRFATVLANVHYNGMINGLISVMRSCLALNPAARPTVEHSIGQLEALLQLEVESSPSLPAAAAAHRDVDPLDFYH